MVPEYVKMAPTWDIQKTPELENQREPSPCFFTPNPLEGFQSERGESQHTGTPCWDQAAIQPLQQGVPQSKSVAVIWLWGKVRIPPRLPLRTLYMTRAWRQEVVSGHAI